MADVNSAPVRPGKGKGRKGRAFPKGRQLVPTAVTEISRLLGDLPRRRNLLIEHLHLIQDKWGHIRAEHLAALAEEMRLSQAEVYEVASFYHHFEVVKEGEAQPAEVIVRVCGSLSCSMAGAQEILDALGDKVPENVKVVATSCMGLCDKAPAAAIGQNYVGDVSENSIRAALEAGETGVSVPDYQGFEDYQSEGGYSQLKRVESGLLKGDEIIETLLEAGLRGLGGAGFPSGQKWKFVLAGDGPRYLCVNADEGEPGTFKDRHYLSKNPHQFFEGALIAARAVEAERVYIYLRDEYLAVREILLAEITTLENGGLIEPGYVELRRGAGAYICGEESAMIESLEGKRGLPRHRPPYVAQAGLFGQPTLVHNVETLYWIPEILRGGAKAFADQGREGHKGLRSYSVSGRVKNPGVVLTAAGASANELIALCGGMADGHSFKAFLPGGPSGGILPASYGDRALDFGSLDDLGCFVGSHAVIVLSDKDDMKDVARNLLAFFKHESCGQCAPCRVGCTKMVRLLASGKWDTELINDLAQVMTDASICGLGQAAPNPVVSLLKYFAEDVS